MKNKLNMLHEKLSNTHVSKLLLFMILLQIAVFFISRPLLKIFPPNVELQLLSLEVSYIKGWYIAIIFAPIVETIIFMTLPLGKYLDFNSRKKWNNKYDIHIILTIAVIFGSFHWIGNGTLASVICVGAGGAIYCYTFLTLYKRNQKATLWTMVLHSASNLVFGLLLLIPELTS